MKIIKTYPIGEPVPDEAVYLQTMYKRVDGANIPYMMFLVTEPDENLSQNKDSDRM